MYLHLYHYDQQGAMSAISRSFNDEGRRSNSEIFARELSEDDMDKIKQIRHRRLFVGDFFVSEHRQYKSKFFQEQYVITSRIILVW